MNKFADWIVLKDKKYRGIAKKLGISTSNLYEILRKGKIPNLKTAYDIENYTEGHVTMYDWLDQKIKQPINNKKISNENKKKKTQ